MNDSEIKYDEVFSSLESLKENIENHKGGNLALGHIAYHLLFSGDPLVRTIWQQLNGNPSWPDTHAYIDEFNKSQQQFDAAKKETWYVDFTEDGVTEKAHAWYLPQSEKTKKTAILLHGFRGPARLMGPWADLLFYQEGYNVVTPTLRGTWESGGKHLALGWNERNDIVSWVNKIIEVEGKDSEIVIFGISGGAATAMMSTGLELPANVKVIVEDCGYTDAYNQIVTILNKYLPILFQELTSSDITEVMLVIYAIMFEKQGVHIFDISAVDCLKENKIPTLFIQSVADEVVPEEMAEQLYLANAGEKQIYYIDGIGHVEGIMQQLPEYKENLHKFLRKYISI